MAAANSNTITPHNIFSVLPTRNFPFSYGEVAKDWGKGPTKGMLLRQAVRDVVMSFDDFNYITLEADHWTVANGGGAAVASFAINTQANGIIRATTGTANGVTASASMIGPVIYQPSQNIGMEIRYKVVTANTSIRMEVGFIDAVPASNTAGFNSMDTPTAFAANAVTVGIDTSATANKLNLFTVGSATNQLVQVAAGTVGLSAAGTYQTVRIQVNSRDLTTNNAADATAWIDGGNQINSAGSATAGVGVVNAQVLLAPWVYIEAINATSKSLDVDYIAVWSQRIT